MRTGVEFRVMLDSPVRIHLCSHLGHDNSISCCRIGEKRADSVRGASLLMQ